MLKFLSCIRLIVKVIKFNVNFAVGGQTMAYLHMYIEYRVHTCVLWNCEEEIGMHAYFTSYLVALAGHLDGSFSHFLFPSFFSCFCPWTYEIERQHSTEQREN